MPPWTPARPVPDATASDTPKQQGSGKVPWVQQGTMRSKVFMYSASSRRSRVSTRVTW